MSVSGNGVGVPGPSGGEMGREMGLGVVIDAYGSVDLGFFESPAITLSEGVRSGAVGHPEGRGG